MNKLLANAFPWWGIVMIVVACLFIIGFYIWMLFFCRFEDKRGIACHLVYSTKTKIWVVKRSNKKKAIFTSSNKREALAKATEYARSHYMELKIHNKDGKIAESISYGNDPKGNG